MISMSTVALSEPRITSAQPAATRSEPSVTFVCCIESGALEDMTVRAAASLRQFGGRFADAPILAVQPRRGVSLTRETRRLMDQYGVVLRRDPSANRHPWFSFFNKLAALSVAEQTVKTETICWIDSDILVLGEPGLFALDSDQDFAACASDNCGGSRGDDDTNDAYWKLVISLAGLSDEDYPWLTNCQGSRLRAYFNSGVFVYRRGRGFFDHYRRTCERLLFSGYKSPVTGVFFTDQVTLAASALASNLRIRALPWEYNYAVGPSTEQPYDPDQVARMIVMHYHAGLCPEYWPAMLAQLQSDRPEVHRWLEPWGAVTGRTHLTARVVRRLLRDYRQWTCKRFTAALREIKA